MQYENPYGTTGMNVPYVDGNPATGVQGSIPPAAAVQNPMTEIVNVISNAGLTPTDTDLSQLGKAIQSGAMNWTGLFGGAANVLTATISPAPTTLIPGVVVRGIIAAANTGAATLNVNGLGPQPITLPNQQALVGGELTALTAMEFLWDGTEFQARSAAFSRYSLFEFTASGTYTPAAWVKMIRVRLVGGGAGGAPAAAAASGNLSIGGGGGAGGYAESIMAAPQTAVAVTIGSGGASGAAGGTTSFGALLSATGGSPGSNGFSVPGPALQGGGISGLGSGGNVLNAAGSPGAYSSGTSYSNICTGAGGGSMFGGGANAVYTIAGTANGNAAHSYGAGGGGASSLNGGGATVGGAGASGIVVIEQWG